jgi:hypothetical protein
LPVGKSSRQRPFGWICQRQMQTAATATAAAAAHYRGHVRDDVSSHKNWLCGHDTGLLLQAYTNWCYMVDTGHPACSPLSSSSAPTPEDGVLNR